MWPYPRIIAHRGSGTLAPENTIAALLHSQTYGFAGVEFDVMLAGNGTPVLMHDSHFGRTIRASGRVADFSADHLARMDAGSWFSPAFRNEGVPTLQRALEACKRENIWANIEIKPGMGEERITGRAVAGLVETFFACALAARPFRSESLPLLSSFSHEALLAAQDIAPQIPRALLVDRIPGDWLPKLRQCGGVALHVGHRHLSQRQAQMVLEAGYGLFCYTVNDPLRAAELLEWGVHAICTDRLDLIGTDFGEAWPRLPNKRAGVGVALA